MYEHKIVDATIESDACSTCVGVASIILCIIFLFSLVTYLFIWVLTPLLTPCIGHITMGFF